MTVKVSHLMPLIRSGEDALHSRYDVRRWYELAGPQGWLRENAASIKAAVTTIAYTSRIEKAFPAPSTRRCSPMLARAMC